MSGSKQYWEFYGDARVDPWRGSYAEAMSTFTAGGDGTRSGFEISEQVNAGAQHDAPFAFLLLVKADGGSKIQCYHRVKQFPPRFGAAPTVWDNKVYAFKGDLYHGRHIPTVEWATEYYEEVEGTHYALSDAKWRS